ncbi:protein KTI12 homolog isoform X2 [Ascaphus truei]|uniref:protein KTI12 homolog isoform X2 n=1 Tax=Ascaphus truei TaxID=8439 RepID=UPI003F5918F4
MQVRGSRLHSLSTLLGVCVASTGGAPCGGRWRDSRQEREIRGSLRAEVERKLNKDDVVILDSLNYIKGYRYELFCLIKHTQTPHCLIYCLTAPEISAAWNRSREEEQRYTDEM